MDYSRIPSNVHHRGVFQAQPPIRGQWTCQLDGCGQSFPDQRDLQRHQKTAKKHAESSFVCSACGNSFTRKDALNRHIKSKHSGDSSQGNYRFVETNVSRYSQRDTSPTPSSGSERSISTPGSTSSSDNEYSPRSAMRNLRSPQIADPMRMIPPSSLPWIYNGHPSERQMIDAQQLPPLRSLQLPKPMSRYA